MMKPSIFLAHSKKDRSFIEHLANDLRSALVNVWYDEWEIPVGESFRNKIFEDGISNCDLFFVYLTPDSIQSYWVKRELDAAFIRDAKLKGGFLSLFVDAEESRKLLSLDLQALHCPVLNNNDYARPLCQLVSRVWEGTLKKSINDATTSVQMENLRLQKNVAELETKIVKLETAGNMTFETTVSHLKSIKYIGEDGEISLDAIFVKLSNLLATGALRGNLEYHIIKILYPKRESAEPFFSLYGTSPYEVMDFIGPLILSQLVYVQPSSGEWADSYYLTDIGKRVVMELLSQSNQAKPLI